MESTTQYEIFKKLSGNAPINPSHLNSLLQAIQKENLLHARPILVNEYMEIIDGQHRLKIAEMLKIPIFYIKIKGLSLKDIASINSHQRNWKLDYFLDLYSDHMNNENYKKLKDWMKENNFSLNQALSFFIEEENVLKFRNNFKYGNFIFKYEYASLSDIYKTFVNKADILCKGIRRHWNQQSFIRAFIIFITNPEIDVKRFFEQMEKYSFLLSYRPTKQQMLEMLHEVYNYRRHIRVETL